MVLGIGTTGREEELLKLQSLVCLVGPVVSKGLGGVPLTEPDLGPFGRCVSLALSSRKAVEMFISQIRFSAPLAALSM